MREKTILVSVYIFTGFLGSGKTTSIQEVFFRGDAFDRENNLIICTEDGEVSYDEDKLKESNTVLVTVDEQSDLTENMLQRLEDNYQPKRVLIEFNGMWDIKAFLECKLPEKWSVDTIFSFVNAQTYDTYLANMRQIIMTPLSVADVIIFNRCTDNTKHGVYRNRIKILNSKAEIYFTRLDGTLDFAPDECMISIRDNQFEVAEECFVQWFMDCIENTDRYYGKEVVLKGFVASAKTLKENQFLIGRMVCVCCSADTQFMGFVAQCDTYVPKNGDWLEVRAEIQKSIVSSRKAIIVLAVNKLKKIEKPKDELLYF